MALNDYELPSDIILNVTKIQLKDKGIQVLNHKYNSMYNTIFHSQNPLNFKSFKKKGNQQIKKKPETNTFHACKVYDNMYSNALKVKSNF